MRKRNPHNTPSPPTHSLTFNMPGGKNHWMLLSSLPNSLPDANGCAGARMYALTSQSASSATVRVAIPAAASGSVTFSLACSVSSGANINRNSATFTVATSCEWPAPCCLQRLPVQLPLNWL